MGWKPDSYKKPDYILKEADLDPVFRYHTPVPVVCAEDRSFCNDSRWLPWPGEMGHLWLESGGRLPPINVPAPVSEAKKGNPGPDLAATITCYPTSLDISSYQVAIMQCSAWPWDEQFTHKGAAGALLALPQGHNLTILWPDNTLITYQDGQAIPYVKFDTILDPTWRRRCTTCMGQGVASQGPARYPRTEMEFEMYFSVYLASENKLPRNKAGKAATTQKPVPFMVWIDLSSIPMISVTKKGCEWIDDTTVRVFGLISIAPLQASLVIASGVFMWVLTALTVLVACGVVCSCTGIRRYVSSCMDRRAAPIPAAAAGGGKIAMQDDLELVMKHGDILAFGGALLFALPTMRGLWPAAPASGTLFDALTIYPQLMLITVALMMLLAKKYVVIRGERMRLSELAQPTSGAVADKTADAAGPPRAVDANSVQPAGAGVGAGADAAAGVGAHDVAVAHQDAANNTEEEEAGGGPGAAVPARAHVGELELVVHPPAPAAFPAPPTPNGTGPAAARNTALQ
jgi:hypothetical protein